ncbi:hypothetical protein FHT86_003528 [Rhizobium sp. BK313]|uniref:hypothetical protein n=1 Tax=Rhizobium sp. BK313 TaxID=2587081 RepID=UPI0010604FFE|nr:hypothetical protein [Rhizobium sp. BK313]MBB3455229.1 hypothetical protein [Rhizobium sp. BK313]
MSDNNFPIFTAICSVVSAVVGAAGGAASGVGPDIFKWYVGETVPRADITKEKDRADGLQKTLDAAKVSSDNQSATIGSLNNKIAGLNQADQKMQSIIDTYHREAARKWFVYGDGYVFPGTGLGVYLDHEPVGKGRFLIKLGGQPRIITVGEPASQPIPTGENCTVVASEPNLDGVYITADCKSAW